MNDHATPSPAESTLTTHDDTPAKDGADAWRMPEHHVRFCTVESCQPDGGSELARLVEERLGVKVDERIYDGSTSLESLECIGLCGIRQAALVDDRPCMGLEAVLRAVDELQEDG